MRVLVVLPARSVACLLMVLTSVLPLVAAGPRVQFTHSFTVEPKVGWSFYLVNFAGDSNPEIAAYNSNNGTLWVARNTGSIFSFSLYATVTPHQGWVFVPGQFYGDSLTDVLDLRLLD